MQPTSYYSRSIKKSLLIKASPDRVFQALTEKADLESWFLKQATVDLRPAGRITFDWGTNVFNTGKILILEPPRRLSYTWEALEPSPTTVTFELTPCHDGTLLLLTHTGIGQGTEWDRYYHSRDSGWNVHLEHLVVWLETGTANPHRPANGPKQYQKGNCIA